MRAYRDQYASLFNAGQNVVVMGISKYFGEMPWYYYIEHIYNEFCEIESYGIPVFFLLSVR